MNRKVSLSGIVAGYFGTLRDDGIDAVSISDVLLQIFVPALLGIGVFVDRSFLDLLPRGNGGVSSNVISWVSITSALLCAVEVFVFQLRYDMRCDSNPTKRTTRLIDELFAILLWAIVEGFVIVGLLVMRGFTSRPLYDNILLALSVMLLGNYCAALCVSLKRMNAAYQDMK